MHLKRIDSGEWQQPAEPQDVQDSPALRQAEEECWAAGQAVRTFLTRRRAELLAKQTRIAAQYMAAFEQWQKGWYHICRNTMLGV